jgi:hypothetical protein
MNSNPLRILLQTTTPKRPDDWSIESFSLLRQHLECSGCVKGWTIAVTARNREASGPGGDPILAEIDRSDFDELWLFALDSGDGITPQEAAAINRFRRRGRGLVTARDHQDLGCSLCSLRGLGAANRFQSRNPESEASRRKADDRETAGISWPNYHSGRNGDFQRIEATEPVHPLLHDPANRQRTLEFFPAHPHEGAVEAPPGDDSARVIAVGRSAATGRSFNLVVAFDGGRDRDGQPMGRAVVHSSFHHFADYNWDPAMGAPSFVTEPAGTGMGTNPRAAADIRTYVGNLARWTAPVRRVQSTGEWRWPALAQDRSAPAARQEDRHSSRESRP